MNRLNIETTTVTDFDDFSSLLTHLPGLAYRCINDPQRTMLYVSDGCQELTGYKQQDLVNNNKKSFTELVHPDDKKYIREQIRNAVNASRPYRLEYRIFTAGGELKWVWEQGMAAPYRESRGPVLEGFITDISNSIRAQQRIKHLNQVLLAIRDVNQLIVKTKDADALIRKSCESLVRTRGYMSAWIALFNEAGQLRKVSASGMESSFAPLFKNLQKGEIPSIIKNVLSESKLFIIENPQDLISDFHKTDFNHTYSIYSRRIEHKNKIYGLLSVVVPRIIMNVQEEKELFKEVVNDIGFSMYSMELDKKRRKMEKLLRTTEERFVYIFNNAGDGIIFISKTGIIREANPALLIIADIRREQIVGKNVTAIAKKHFSLVDQAKIMKKLAKLLAGERIKPFELQFYHKTLELSVPSDHTIYGYTCIIRDITERKKAEQKIKESLKEKEFLIQEIHHRVKNNLQIIRSLIDLQSSQIKDRKALEALTETKTRVQAMALVHERAYRDEHFVEIHFKNYIETIVEELFNTYEITGRITLQAKIEDIGLGIDNAIPCGLIINELITNSLKHAFPDEQKGIIFISLRNLESQVKELIVRDNGIGFPEDVQLENATSLGITLIKILTKQINGSITLNRHHGTEFIIQFRGVGK